MTKQFGKQQKKHYFYTMCLVLIVRDLIFFLFFNICTRFNRDLNKCSERKTDKRINYRYIARGKREEKKISKEVVPI